MYLHVLRRYGRSSLWREGTLRTEALPACPWRSPHLLGRALVRLFCFASFVFSCSADSCLTTSFAQDLSSYIASL